MQCVRRNRKGEHCPYPAVEGSDKCEWHINGLPRCEVIKTDGAQCKGKVMLGHTKCKPHLALAEEEAGGSWGVFGKATRCVIVNRRGVRCRAPALRGTDKCKRHCGGRNKQLRHGLSSRFGAPEKLRERIEALINDPKIVDIKQYAARIFMLLESIEAKVQGGEFTDADREKLLPLLKRGVEASEKFHRLATDKRFVDILEAQGFVTRALHAVWRFIPEDRRVEAVRVVEDMVGKGESTDLGEPPASLH